MNTNSSATRISAQPSSPSADKEKTVNEGHSFFVTKLREFVAREALDYDSLSVSENAPVDDMDSTPDIFYNTSSELIIGEAKPNKKEIRSGYEQMRNYLTYAAKHADNRKVTVVYSVPWNHHYLVYRMFDDIIAEAPSLASLIDGRVTFELRCIGEEYNEVVPMPASLGDRFVAEPRKDQKVIGDLVISGTFYYIPIEKLHYDENNIRLYGSGRNLTQEQCANRLARELTVNNTHAHSTAERSIANMKSAGTISETLYGEPRDDGGVDILEGNRRLYYANQLYRNAKEAPGYSYLPVFVFDKRLTGAERILFKSYLQESGKINHLRHARAYEIWQLAVRDHMDHETISKFMVLENDDIVRNSIDCCEMCFNTLKMSDEEYERYYGAVYTLLDKTSYARSDAGMKVHASDESRGITVENMIRAIMKSGNDDWNNKVGIGTIRQIATAYNSLVRLNDENSNITQVLENLCKTKQGYITPKEWIDKYKSAAGKVTFGNAKKAFKSGCTNMNSFQNEIASLCIQGKLSDDQKRMVDQAIDNLVSSLALLRLRVNQSNWEGIDKISSGNYLGK